ncbi:MAG: trehalase family glycosidase [Bryobacteraceae bacterium]
MMRRREAVLLMTTALAVRGGSLPTFEELRTTLPEPILDAKPKWIAAYWKAWELASHNFHEPAAGSGFPSRFIDAAFSDNIYFWDTAFMTMFSNVAGKLVPGIGSLDNFYAKQHADGEIAREIVRATGEDYFKWVNTERRPFFSRWGWDGFGPKMKVLGPDAPVQYVGRKPPSRLPDLTLDNLNHPIAAWAELESYRYTGDRDRIGRVFPALAAYYAFLDEHLRQGNGLYMTDWASMDDSPRNIYLKGGGTGIDISSEMVLFANNLAEMARLLNRPSVAEKYSADAADVSRRINQRMWNSSKRFYVDLKLDGEQAPVKTIAGFWPLIARVSSADRAKALADHLRNPKTFGTPRRVPTCAADEPSYRAGVYWQGAVWAPTNTMVLRGLEAYGEHDLSRTIALEHIETVSATLEKTGTIWENYSPTEAAPGRPARKNFVGWSGIGPILYLLEYGVGLKPDAPRNRLEWRIDGTARVGCRRYRFNGHVVDLIAEGGVVRVESDGAFELRLNGKAIAVKAGKQEFRLGR